MNLYNVEQTTEEIAAYDQRVEIIIAIVCVSVLFIFFIVGVIAASTSKSGIDACN